MTELKGSENIQKHSPSKLCFLMWLESKKKKKKVLGLLQST